MLREKGPGTMKPATAAVVAVLAVLVPVPARSHGHMFHPTPRQPEPLYWYQVGCMIGCNCSGGGKETYPSLASTGCTSPAAGDAATPTFVASSSGCFIPSSSSSFL